MKPNVDKFFEKLSEKNLIKVYKELTHNKLDGIVKSVSQIIINQYGVDPLYASTIIRNNVHAILSKRYVKLKEKLNKNKNESKKS